MSAPKRKRAAPLQPSSANSECCALMESSGQWTMTLRVCNTVDLAGSGQALTRFTLRLILDHTSGELPA